MGAMERTKGMRGELELSRAIHERLGVRLSRNLTQSRNGGADLIQGETVNLDPVARWIGGLAIECKRSATVTPSLLDDWWRQTVVQASEAGKVPCLCYRQDRRDWRITLPMAVIRPGLPLWDGLELSVEVTIDGFAVLAREAAGPSGTILDAGN